MLVCLIGRHIKNWKRITIKPGGTFWDTVGIGLEQALNQLFDWSWV